MPRMQQRLNRLEAATPDDNGRSTVTLYLEMLEDWKTLFEDRDGEIPESVRRDCERLVEQVRSGEVDYTSAAIIDRIPPSVMSLFEKNAKRIYGPEI